MVIYNVTVNVENEILSEWMTWMKEEHIPEVLETGLFNGATFSKLLIEEEQGVTFSIQYRLKDLASYQVYNEMYAPQLQADHKNRFGVKAVAFRTLMEVLADYTAERLD